MTNQKYAVIFKTFISKYLYTHIWREREKQTDRQHTSIWQIMPWFIIT